MLQPGALIHERYRIVGLVGQGAMGAVYEAIDQRIGQPVALKQTLTADPAAMGALEREGLILAGLHHPALPTVSDTFSDRNGQFLAMSFVPGPTLADLLDERGRPFAPAEVLAWADQILDALGYLHGQAPPVLHRDVKPQNLKLAPNGRIVLLDFGLARGAIFQTRLAGQRSVVGYTLPYAPLEQVRGQDTDPRSDLFALAGTLYHLLTGAPPPDALERAAARIAGEPDPLRSLGARCPGLPAAAALAIERCLSLDPVARVGSAAELRDQLRSPERPVEWSPSPPPTPARLRVIIAIAIALLASLLLIRLVMLGFNRPAAPGVALYDPTAAVSEESAYPYPTPRSVDDNPYPYPTPRMMGGAPSPAPALYLTADARGTAVAGGTAAYPIPTEPLPAMVAATAAVNSPRLRIDCAAARRQGDVALSADGMSVALNCGSGIYAFETLNGRAIMSFAFEAESIAFSPDGAWLATTSFAHRNDVTLWNTATGQIGRRIAFPDEFAIASLQFSPDGKLLAALGDDGLLDFAGAASGALFGSMLQPGIVARALAFSADSRYVAVGTAAGELYVWQRQEGPFAYVEVFRSTGRAYGEITSLAFSADGATLLAGFSEGGVWRYRFAEASPGTFVGGRRNEPRLATSPVDERYAVGDALGGLEIYRGDKATPLHVLQTGGPAVFSLSFTPDGSALVVRTANDLEIWSLPDQPAR